MNNRNEQERRETQIMDIVGMVITGLMVIVSFIAGCCGKYHQFWIAGICAGMFIGFYLEYKLNK